MVYLHVLRLDSPLKLWWNLNFIHISRIISCFLILLFLIFISLSVIIKHLIKVFHWIQWLNNVYLWLITFTATHVIQQDLLTLLVEVFLWTLKALVFILLCLLCFSFHTSFIDKVNRLRQGHYCFSFIVIWDLIFRKA